MKKFDSYIRSMLSDEQINNLRFALRNDIHVHFYGKGLGKSMLAKLLRMWGYYNVSEVGDPDLNNYYASVNYIPKNCIAIEFTKTTFDEWLDCDPLEIYECRFNEVNDWILKS